MTVELQNLLASKFIARTDVKAVQSAEGAWRPIREKWTRDDFAAHLEGRRSFGHYMLNADSECKLFAFDIDLAKDARPGENEEVEETYFDGRWLPGSPREFFATFESDAGSKVIPALHTELRLVAAGLAARAARMYDVQTAISFSGSKGLHVYCFTGLAPAADVRAAALDVIMSSGAFEPQRGNNFFKHRTWFPNVEVEVFPKQDSLEGKDLGNLMRLPLGTHAKSGREAFFINPLAPDDALAAMDPVTAMTSGIDWTAEVAA